MPLLNVYEIAYNVVKTPHSRDSVDARSTHKKILVATTDQATAESKMRATETSGIVHIESVSVKSVQVLT